MSWLTKLMPARIRTDTGAAHSLPDPPETASDGIAAAIWV